MALEHGFFLIPKSVDITRFWMNTENNPEIIDSVGIHDDIIQYISDTLKWIPSRNPAKNGNPKGMGINYYGVTLFDQDSSEELNNIFISWRNLFKNSPKVLKLTGEFTSIIGEENSGQYDKLILNRVKLYIISTKWLLFPIFFKKVTIMYIIVESKCLFILKQLKEAILP
jgi:hypothetical protein